MTGKFVYCYWLFGGLVVVFWRWVVLCFVVCCLNRYVNSVGLILFLFIWGGFGMLIWFVDLVQCGIVVSWLFSLLVGLLFGSLGFWLFSCCDCGWGFGFGIWVCLIGFFVWVWLVYVCLLPCRGCLW